MKSNLVRSMCLLSVGCSISHAITPEEIVLTYGESSISAAVQEGNLFKATGDTDSEAIEFSGSVTKQDNRYLIRVAFDKEAKTGSGNLNLNTTVVMQIGESVMIGRTNDEVFRLFLR